jgi:hypothetical protein
MAVERAVRLETQARARRVPCSSRVCPSSSRNLRGRRRTFEATRAVSRKRLGRSCDKALKSVHLVHRRPRWRLAVQRRASQDSRRERLSASNKWTSERGGSKTEPSRASLSAKPRSSSPRRPAPRRSTASASRSRGGAAWRESSSRMKAP